MKIHLQTLTLMQQGKISKRAAILLGNLDYSLSPYETRQMTFGGTEAPYGFVLDGDPVYGHEHVRHGFTAPEHVAFWEVSLCNMLACRDVRTLRATIRELRKATIDGKRFFKAKRGVENGHPYYVFKLRGRPLSNQVGDLWITPDIKECFEHGQLSATEMLTLAWVWSFQRNGKKCYAKNATLAKFLGIKVRTVKNMLSRLYSRNILCAERHRFSNGNRISESREVYVNAPEEWLMNLPDGEIIPISQQVC